MNHPRVVIPVLILALAGCVAPSGDYDPDHDAEGVVAGGKADGLLDAAPSLAIGGEASGEVGADRMEIYRLDLQRTDRVEIEMEVDRGDLNPHLSLYRGTTTYIGSESWERDGDILRKVYEAEYAGTYVLAARAYRGEGQGEYTVRVRCLSGPCNGDLPPPDPDEVPTTGEVAGCFTQTRRCAFERLPRYNGAVGATRAAVLVEECLAEAALPDGSACAGVVDWVNPDDSSDTAAGYFQSLRDELPFWADQTTECHGVLDSCMGECFGAGSSGSSWDASLQDEPGIMCWSGIWNGDCNSFARGHEACGGETLAGSSAECTRLCHSTTGAFLDDLDTLCSSDSDCEDYCDVDIDAAAARCGGLSQANEGCILSRLDDTEAYSCEGAVADRIATLVPLATCTWSTASELPATSGDLTPHVQATTDLTRWYVDDLQAYQLVVASAQLGFGETGVSKETALERFDEGQAEHLAVSVNGRDYGWIRGYAGDNEVGVIFRAGTLEIVGEVSDGDIMGCE